MRRKVVGWCGALLALSCAGSALAAPAGGGISGAELAKLLQDAGYRAKLETDKDGDPMIHTRMSGVNVYIYTYDCEAGRCGSLQFSVGLDLDEGTTLAVANAFNRDFRYTRVYLDDEMDPFLQLDFEVEHANHAELVNSQIELWEDILGEFLSATGYRTDDDDAPAGDAKPVEAILRT